MNFVIKGLPADQFRHLYGMSDDELKAHGAKRYACDATPGFPDRIEMRDADIGETMLLVNHTSMDKHSPYRATHAIYVREGAEQSYEARNEVPEVMRSRMLSLRAFDSEGMIIDADLASGDAIQPLIQKMLANSDVVHIDAHNAARGCFSGRITRG